MGLKLKNIYNKHKIHEQGLFLIFVLHINILDGGETNGVWVQTLVACEQNWGVI